MKNLIGMVAFVLERNKAEESCREDFVKCVRYANFLKQPLTLGMFVPAKLVDGVWVVLEEPKCYGKKYTEDIAEEELILHEEFVQAKERCLFDGFEVVETPHYNTEMPKSICIYEFLHVFWWHKNQDKWELSKEISTIEDLVKYNLELTPTAQKQIGL